MPEENYTTIYIRATGNDSSGDGSLSSPYLTAQKAFEIAYSQHISSPTLDIILDFGIGNFGGVVLKLTNATEWPSQIKVYGVNIEQSLFGGINGTGNDAVFDENGNLINSVDGYNIHVISNKLINLGDIIAPHGPSASYWTVGATSGNITLENAYCEDVISCEFVVENYHTNNGNITLTDTICKNILANASSTSYLYSGISLNRSVADNIVSTPDCFGGSPSAPLTLVSSSCKNITLTSSGSNSSSSVSLINSTSLNITAGSTCNGNGGIVSLNNSACGTITTDASEHGGNITIVDSKCGNISGNYGSGFNGTNVTLSGNTIIPNLISYAININTTNLKKGRGINGSSILGIV
jgi:hypothetical protein